MALRKQDVHDNNDRQQASTQRTRITFDISPQLRRRIKMAADLEDSSIGEYLSGILEQFVPEEVHLTQTIRPITQKSLDDFLQIRDELLKERNGVPFSDSTEIIHQMRE